MNKISCCTILLSALGCASNHQACPPQPVHHTTSFSGTQEREVPTDADIKRLLEVTHVKEVATQVIHKMMIQMKQNAPKVPEQFWSDFETEFDVNRLCEMMFPVYRKHLSRRTVLAAIAFMETPEGKLYANASQAMAAEGQEIGAKWGSIIVAQVLEKLESKGYAKD
jgi:uncharacterized protein involved in copper resistance